MCTLPLLAGENVRPRFVVPTVAASVDLVVHVGARRGGARRVREIVALPGRVEGDVVETADIFTTRDGRLVRADGCPPHQERFARPGYDLAALLPGTSVEPRRRRHSPARSLPWRALLGRSSGSCCCDLARRARPAVPGQSDAVPASGSRLGDRALRQAGVEGVSPAQLVARPVAAAAWSSSSSPCWRRAVAAIAVCFGVFGLGPLALVRRCEPRAAGRELRDVWPEVVDNLASAVRAGLSLPEALVIVGSPRAGVAAGAVPPVRRGLPATRPVRDCLDRLKAALADPVGDRILETVRVAREVGGSDLGRCCARCRPSCARTPAPGRSSRPGRAGRSTPPGWRSPRRGWCCSCWARGRQRSRPTTRRPARWCSPSAAPCRVVAYRIMLRIGRLPEEQRVLR